MTYPAVFRVGHGSTHYAIGQLISKMLNPLTLNAYQLKDSFDTAECIKRIPRNLLNEGYALVSLDVVSLFTNVPLKKPVSVILRRIYEENTSQSI